LALGAALGLLIVACGDEGPAAVRATSSNESTPATATPTASAADTPVAAADAFIADWRSGQLDSAGSLTTAQALDDAKRTSVDVSMVAGRGCARPEQVPGDDPAGATMVCVYLLPLNRGEIHVAVAPLGPQWQVVGVDVS